MKKPRMKRSVPGDSEGTRLSPAEPVFVLEGSLAGWSEAFPCFLCQGESIHPESTFPEQPEPRGVQHGGGIARVSPRSTAKDLACGKGRDRSYGGEKLCSHCTELS